MGRDKGDGTLFFRKDRQRWVTQITMPDGSRPGFSSRKWSEARDWLRDMRAARDRGELVGTTGQTVSQFADAWLSDHVEPRVRWHTYVSYEGRLRHILPYIGGIKLSRLTPADIDRAISQMRGHSVSPSEIAQTIARLRQMLRYAVKRRELTWNPADAIDPPTVTRPEHPAMTAEQVQRLLSETGEHRLHALWALLIGTGLRIGEAVALRWSTVDLERCQLTVEATLSKRKGQPYEFGPPKTKGSRGTVAFGPNLQAMLQTHRTRQLEERLAAPSWEGSDLVFPRENGRPLPPSSALRIFGEELERIGLPHFRLHDLRHTTASLLLAERDMPGKYAQEILRHSSIAQTMDTYSHLFPVGHREAALRIDAALKQGEDEGHGEKPKQSG